MPAKRRLWEVLVPTLRNGKPVRTKSHQEWDRRIRKISGGLTIMPVTKGQWISPAGSLFVERMIPVRVLATEKEVEKIVDITLDFYEQEAVLAYEISRNVILKHRKPKTS